MKIEYSKDEVIICKSKADAMRLSVGDTVYYHNSASMCLIDAMEDRFPCILEEIDWTRAEPFKADCEWWECVIIKKKVVKKEVPLNFRDPEDRKLLMNSWFRERRLHEPDCNYMRAVEFAPERIWIGVVDDPEHDGYSPKRLLEELVFADGSICGHIVEEVDR